MIIAQISDSHITAKGEMAQSRLASLEACVHHINALRPKPDIVIHTGDLTHDDLDAEYEMAMNIMGELKAPLYFIPGNRDNRNHMRALFAKHFPLTTRSPYFCYAIDKYPVQLIALDTTSDTSALGQFCQERANFLKAALAQIPAKPLAKPRAKPRAKPALIFMHHPPYDAMEAPEPYQFQFEDRAMTKNFEHIIAGHEGPLRIICGHIHRNTSGTISGVTASSMTSVALDLRKGDYFGDEAEAVIYHVHEFDHDGSSTTRLESVTMPAQYSERTISREINA